jgi:hypothetical protein
MSEKMGKDMFAPHQWSGKSVGMIALKNKDDDEPTYTGAGWFVAGEESESYIIPAMVEHSS